jgi:hypothetical protein
VVDFFVQMPDLQLGFQIDLVIGSENFASFRVFGGLEDILHGIVAFYVFRELRYAISVEKSVRPISSAHGRQIFA